MKKSGDKLHYRLTTPNSVGPVRPCPLLWFTCVFTLCDVYM